MAQIPEDNVSTASDDEEDEINHSDEENINHSDIEDLVRWVSRRDPPSDGEARRLQGEHNNQVSKTDSGHESLGHSDVEDLVRWVSRKDGAQTAGFQSVESTRVAQPSSDTAYYYDSDASTESDSEGAVRKPGHKDSINEEDVDDLVRWISRKDGPNAGPVRKSNDGSESGAPTGPEAQDPQTDELSRWVAKKDETSGESENASQKSLPTIAEPTQGSKATPKAGSRLKREVSHTKPAAMESETALTHDDVDDLVRFVSRKNTDTKEVETRDDEIFKWKEEEDSLRVREPKRLT